MKKVSFIFISLLFASTAMQAQDFARAGAALSAASEAFESGDYRTALSSVATFEQAMGKATAYSHYLKIMSYYKLKDYESCKQQAIAYLKTAETDDDYTPEIRKIYNELQGKTQTANTSAAIVKATAQNSVVINGVRWAKFNVGEKGIFVENQYDYGNYYTWEEAKTVCPAGWRLPTEEDWKSLVQSGSDVVDKGREFGKGDNKIFLPFAGYRNFSDNSMKEVGTDGNYWSGTPNDSDRAYLLGFADDHARLGSNNKKYAISVRCVCEQ